MTLRGLPPLSAQRSCLAGVLLLVLCAGTPASHAQQAPAIGHRTGPVLAGRVSTGNGQPVRRARVVASGPVAASTETDTDGVFRFSGLPTGHYTVAAAKPGLVALGPTHAEVAPGTPPVNLTVELTPAGAISGRLVDTSGTALVDAPVTLFAGEQFVARVATDDRGVFRFHTLLPGVYQFKASTDGLQQSRAVEVRSGRESDVVLVSTLGRTASFPDRPLPVVLSGGRQAGTADIALPSRKVITGRVVDEFGDPAPDISVVVVENQVAAAGRRLVPAAEAAVTDDRGEFRIRGIAPGSYFLVALSGPFTTTSVFGGPAGPPSEGAGFALTFFPGTATPTDAEPLEVGILGAPSPVVMPLIPSATGSVTGLTVNGSGQPVPDANVILLPLHGGDVRVPALARATTNAEGRFMIRNVPVGVFVVQAFGAGGFASAPVSVSDHETPAATLTLSPPSAVRGRILLDGPSDSSHLKRIRISAIPTDFVRSPAGSVAPRTSVADDGSFEITGLRGVNQLRFDLPPPWALVAITSNGREITDVPIDSTVGDRNDVRVVFAPTANTVSFLVSDRQRRSLAEAFVLIFPQTANLAVPPTRYVRGLSAGADGDFTTRALPPGAYRAVAFGAIPRADWMDADFLESLRGQGEAFTIGHGESLTVRLGIIR